jgi:uncharacterized protein
MVVSSMAVLPMFPLGAVLLPHMPLQLRVFEERYLIMLSDLLAAEEVRFGVVLIERGQEVGGGDLRFPIGTIAEVQRITAGEGFVNLTARGTERIEVVEWLEDAPYPRAEVAALPELVWHASLETLREKADRLVRRTLAIASEFADDVWPADIELSNDPVEACWQLAGIAPVTSLDQLALLSCDSMHDLLAKLIKLTEEAARSRYAG